MAGPLIAARASPRTARFCSARCSRTEPRSARGSPACPRDSDGPRPAHPFPTCPDPSTWIAERAMAALRGLSRFVRFAQVLLFLTCSPRLARTQPSEVFVVRNARVFDGDQVLEVASVLVREGR